MRVRISHHAAQRCEEMQVPRAVVDQIVCEPSITRPAKRGCFMATSDRHPDYAVVYEQPEPDLRVIVTVVFRTCEVYVRQGTTYEPRSS